MHSNEVQGFIDEVVAKSLEEALHQGHAEAEHPRPAGGVLGLPRETLRHIDAFDYQQVEIITDYSVRACTAFYANAENPHEFIVSDLKGKKGKKEIIEGNKGWIIGKVGVRREGSKLQRTGWRKEPVMEGTKAQGKKG